MYESNDFIEFELTLSEKQIPRFVGNAGSSKLRTELLQSSLVSAGALPPSLTGSSRRRNIWQNCRWPS